jgi:hypothetical protein
VEQTDFPDRLPEILGDFLELFIRDPNSTRAAGAAVAALGAGEIQAIPVPGLVV